MNAVQKPEVLDATSDLNEVVIRAMNGTTQITRIIASMIWAKDRLYMIDLILNVPIVFVRGVFAIQEKPCEE